MNVSLTEQLEAFVNCQVKGGDYNNASEVIREALRLLKEQKSEEAEKKAALIKAIEKGLNSPIINCNTEDFIKEMNEEFAKKQKTK